MADVHAGDVTADSASLTVHDTFTSLVYQPFVPDVPVTRGLMTGGVVSGGAKTVKT